MNRQLLRSCLRNERDAFVSETKLVFPVSAELMRALARARCVGLYLAMGSEVDPSPIIAWCAGRSLPIALPRVEGRGSTMDFRRWSPGQPLDKAAFGFAQPLAEAEAARPDLVLVPLVGFDRRGNRIGQGAGHYDRYFAMNFNSLKVGLAWSMQEVPAIAAAPWDVPLDAICTEREWIVA
jgi:5-formyltetrahydrofolate cyclo-ligase